MIFLCAVMLVVLSTTGKSALSAPPVMMSHTPARMLKDTQVSNKRDLADTTATTTRSSHRAAKRPSLPIKTIEIYGTKKVPDSQVKSWLQLQEGQPFAADRLFRGVQNIVSNYVNRGYLFARVDSALYRSTPDSDGMVIQVYLTENNLIEIGDLKINGVDSLQARAIKRRFNTRPGQQPNPQRIEADLDDALTQLENNGYPFSRFRLKAIGLDYFRKGRERLGMEWNLAPGPQLHLDEVQIIGNKMTKEKVILREIRFKPGEIYDRRKVEKIPQRLMKTGFFRRVDEPQVFVAQGNRGGLLLRVEEGNASRFDGVVGYNPGTVDRKGYITGLIDIALGNLLGTGRSLFVHWQKRDRRTQDMKFHYREPWVAGLPVNIGFGFDQLIQDTTYVQRDLGLDVSMPLLENLNLIGTVTRTEISPDSVGSYLLGILHSRTLNASIGISYDTRDDWINPRKGVYYQTFVQAGRKRNLGPDALITELDFKRSIDNKKLSLDVEWYGPLFSRSVLAVTLHGRQIQSNEKFIPISDQFRLGGARTLRGYSEDQFRGSSVAWSNLELRYILGRRSRVFLFLDNGYYQSESAAGKRDGYKMGYGLGFRLETGLGIMGIDYGLGKGDSLFNGKVHVGLINEF